LAALVYDIRVVGAETVSKALGGIERRIAQHNARVTTLTGQGPGKNALAARVPRATGALPQVDREERERTRLAQRHEKQRMRLRLNTIERERVERLKSERQEKAGMRERLRMAQREATQRAAFVRHTLGDAAGRVGRTVRAVGMVGGAMIGVGGAALAAAAVGQAARMDEAVRRVIINARAAGTEPTYTPKELTKQFTQTGIATGIDPEKVAGGAARFVAVTGEINAAVEQSRTLATFAQATGAEMTDLAGIAAAMWNQGIRNTADMSQALATLTFQGKKSSFELKDMAQFMPEVMATFGRLGVSGVKGTQSVGGWLQLAMMGTQNPAEAATSAMRMASALEEKGTDIESGKAFGGRKVKVFTDKTKSQMRSPDQVIPEILAASRGNIPELAKVFQIRGIRAVSMMQKTYNEAAAGPGTAEEKVARGSKAVAALLKDFSEVSGSYTDIQRDAADAMKSFNVQMGLLSTQIKAAIASDLFPELVKLGPDMAKLVPYVAQFTKAMIGLAKWIATNPFTAVGSLVAAQIAASFVRANLAAVLTRLLTRAMVRAPAGGGAGATGAGGFRARVAAGGGAGAVPPAFMGRPAAGGYGAAAGLGATLGLTAAAVIVTAGIANFEAGEVRMNVAGKVVRELEGEVPQTPEEAKAALTKARAAVEEQRGRVTGADAGRSGWLGATTNFITGGQGDVEYKTQESMLARLQARQAELEKTFDALSKAATAAAANLDKLDPSKPNTGNTPSPVKK
jgi:hypothetical protein